MTSENQRERKNIAVFVGLFTLAQEIPFVSFHVQIFVDVSLWLYFWLLSHNASPFQAHIYDWSNEKKGREKFIIRKIVSTTQTSAASASGSKTFP